MSCQVWTKCRSSSWCSTVNSWDQAFPPWRRSVPAGLGPGLGVVDGAAPELAEDHGGQAVIGELQVLADRDRRLVVPHRDPAGPGSVVTRMLLTSLVRPAWSTAFAVISPNRFASAGGTRAVRGSSLRRRRHRQHHRSRGVDRVDRTDHHVGALEVLDIVEDLVRFAVILRICPSPAHR